MKIRILLFQLILLISASPPVLSSLISFCDFEDNYSCPWQTTEENGFSTKKAKDVSSRGFPEKDASTGTDQGHYILAVGEAGEELHQTTRTLFSPCYPVEEQVCSIHFKAVVSGSQQNEKLLVYVNNHCGTDSAELPKRPLIGPINPPGPLTHTNGSWVEQSIYLNKLPMMTSYQIILAADVPQEDSYIAIDSISLKSCQKDKIPPRAVNSFNKCDLSIGSCGWLNSAETTAKWRLSDRDKSWMSNNRHGNYVYVKKGRKKQVAVLNSVVHPKPRYRSDNCTVGFYYLMSDNIESRLKLEWRKPCYDTSAKFLWETTGREPLKWYHEVVELNIDSSYILVFTADVDDNAMEGIGVALDDITFSPSCYSASHSGSSGNHFDFQYEYEYSCGPDFFFSTCGAVGQKGPSQKLCNAEYKQSSRNISVQVEDGVQVWTIPETGIYSITAVGASGGLGTESGSELSRGGYVHGKFNFTSGTKLYLLVGQEGESACLKAGFESSSFCLMNSVKNNSTGQTSPPAVRGGGGGGGGTFIYQIKPNGEIYPLIVAGGGSGLPYNQTDDVKMLAGGITVSGSGLTGKSTDHTSGAGGGLYGSSVNTMTGQSLANGADGGTGCMFTFVDKTWSANGGFGGGGGGCRSGGGGGGYSGGNVSGVAGKSIKGGSSHISHQANDVLLSAGINSKGAGFIEIVQILYCPCELMCIWSDFTTKTFRCLCPVNKTLSSDGTSCIEPKASILQTLAVEKMPIGYIVVIGVSCAVIFFVILAVFAFINYHRRKNDKTKLSKLQRAMSPSNVIGGRGFQQAMLPSILMLNNPNYNMLQPAVTPDPVLTEISRKHLTLISLIGQGAFGEVYEGVLSGPPYDTDVSIAVKTLPAMCTEQTELDFLMEAVIISKFNHPNIVSFIGVCFDKEPRFIILELLEGGDVRSFLRESRPKPSRPSELTVLDLLKLALDIAKGCQHLEEKHFIHRDIAARNCLLSKKGPTRVAKIADFGLARDIYRSDYYKKAGKAMLPVKWMPPEAFLDGMFTSKTDVWSFGILLWEIFALGHVPYPGCSNEEVMHFVTVGGRLQPPESCPAAVFDVMASCWSGIAEERPSFNLIITSLEKSIQDDDVALRGLPVFYLPPLLTSHRSYLPMSNYVTPFQTSLCEPCDYLEPLIPNINHSTVSTMLEYPDSGRQMNDTVKLEYRDSGHPCNDAMHSSGNISQMNEMGADSVFEDSAVDVKLLVNDQDSNLNDSLHVTSLNQLSTSSPATLGFMTSMQELETSQYNDIIPLNTLQTRTSSRRNNGSLPLADVLIQVTKS